MLRLNCLYCILSPFPSPSPLPHTLTPDEGSELRLQRLREWKAKRTEAREKEKAAKKKPFYGGKLVVTTTAAVSKVSSR